jgi:high-affinity iron transporter
MLAVAIIVFREVLEAALIVSIVMAASVGVAGRTLWVAGGIGAGVCGAGLVHARLAQPLDGASCTPNGR